MNFIRQVSTILLCTIIGVVIASAPAVASFNGLFVKWAPIGAPPEKAVEILELDYFRSNTGSIYHLYYDAKCRSGCWEKVETLPRESEYFILPLEDCDAFPFLPFTSNFVQSKKSCVRWGVGTDMMAQAIDHEGIIYMWNHRLTELTFLTPLLSSITGAILGFLFGLSQSIPRSAEQRDGILEDRVAQ